MEVTHSQRLVVAARSLACASRERRGRSVHDAANALLYAESLSHQGGDSRTLKPVTDIAEFDSKLAEIARDFEIDTRECTSHTELGGERNDRS